MFYVRAKICTRCHLTSFRISSKNLDEISHAIFFRDEFDMMVDDKDLNTSLSEKLGFETKKSSKPAASAAAAKPAKKSPTKSKKKGGANPWESGSGNESDSDSDSFHSSGAPKKGNLEKIIIVFVLFRPCFYLFQAKAQTLSLTFPITGHQPETVQADRQRRSITTSTRAGRKSR